MYFSSVEIENYEAIDIINSYSCGCAFSISESASISIRSIKFSYFNKILFFIKSINSYIHLQYGFILNIIKYFIKLINTYIIIYI